MPVNLPQPLFVPGGQNKPRSTAEQFLLTLLSQAPDIGFGIANMVQQGNQRSQGDEAAAAVLQGMFKSGAIDSSFAEAIPGFDITQLQGDIPGAPVVSGNVPTKGASTLLDTLLTAQQGQASIEASRAATSASRGQEQRAGDIFEDEKEALRAQIDQARAGTRRTNIETSLAKDIAESQNSLRAAQAMAAEASATASRANARRAEAEIQQIQTKVERENKQFVREGVQGDINSVAAYAATLRNIDPTLDEAEARRQAAQSYQMPIDAAGMLDKESLLASWRNRVEGGNFDPDQFFVEAQEELNALGNSLDVSPDARQIIEDQATAMGDLPDAQKAQRILEMVSTTDPPMQVEALLNTTKYLSARFNTPLDLPEEKKTSLGARVLGFLSKAPRYTSMTGGR